MGELSKVRGCESLSQVNKPEANEPGGKSTRYRGRKSQDRISRVRNGKGAKRSHKSFLCDRAHRGAFVFLALSRTPVYTARSQIIG